MEEDGPFRQRSWRLTLPESPLERSGWPLVSEKKQVKYDNCVFLKNEMERGVEGRKESTVGGGRGENNLQAEVGTAHG